MATSGEVYELEYELQTSVLREVFRSRQGASRQALVVCALLAAAIGGSLLLTPQRGRTLLIVVDLLIGLTMINLARATWRRALSTTARRGTHHVRLTDEGLHFTNAEGNGITYWPAIRSVWRGKRAWLLRSGGSVIVLPAEQLADGAGAFVLSKLQGS
jgi:hypothetical protein